MSTGWLWVAWLSGIAVYTLIAIPVGVHVYRRINAGFDSDAAGVFAGLFWPVWGIWVIYYFRIIGRTPYPKRQ